jgi:hypothetical protein
MVSNLLQICDFLKSSLPATVGVTQFKVCSVAVDSTASGRRRGAFLDMKEIRQGDIVKHRNS